MPTSNPKWWNDQTTSAWDRAKEAMRRDWEQTKADFTKTKGRDLDQDVGDTVKQATGSAPIPPRNVPNQPSGKKEDWSRIEEGVRYGYGAGVQYKEHAEWDDRLESKLKTEWDDLKSGRTWDEVKSAVKHGFHASRKKGSS